MTMQKIATLMTFRLLHNPTPEQGTGKKSYETQWGKTGKFQYFPPKSCPNLKIESAERGSDFLTPNLNTVPIMVYVKYYFFGRGYPVIIPYFSHPFTIKPLLIMLPYILG